MVYRGGPPANAEDTAKLQPGWHSVRITKVVKLSGGMSEGFLAILENRSGEAAEFVPYDITPPRSKEEQKGNSAWKFWRLVAGFDYPSQEYWETPREERPEMAWDPEAILDEIKDKGTWAVIEVSQFRDRKGNVKPSIESVLSPRRKEIPYDLKEGQSVSVAPPKEDAFDNESTVGSSEVPF